jgi:hypothetical protein
MLLFIVGIGIFAVGLILAGMSLPYYLAFQSVPDAGTNMALSVGLILLAAGAVLSIFDFRRKKSAHRARDNR